MEYEDEVSSSFSYERVMYAQVFSICLTICLYSKICESVNCVPLLLQLTGGHWSPTRPAVFMTTKMDGSLDVWDYFYKQKEPTLSIQVHFFPIELSLLLFLTWSSSYHVFCS